MDSVIDIEINKKTKYRLFKRCFKYPSNTITKFIWNFINKSKYRTKNIKGGYSYPRWKYKRFNETTNFPSIARKLYRKQFASTKGFSKLRKSGQLY